MKDQYTFTVWKWWNGETDGKLNEVVNYHAFKQWSSLCHQASEKVSILEILKVYTHSYQVSIQM